MSKRQQAVPKGRLPSRWERERRRRHIVEIVIAVAIISVVVIVSYGYYDIRIKPWRQAIVRVNDKVFDMRYFVKTLRLYGAGQNPTQDVQLAQSLVEAIQNNELIRQGAERFGIYLNATEMENKLKEYAGFNPEEETEEEFYERLEGALEEVGVSIKDFKRIIVEPMVLQPLLLEVIGNNEYPQDTQYEHVRVQAVLLGTEEEALEAKTEWEADPDTGFEGLINATPSRYYPKDDVEWLPLGIESPDFDNFAFGEGSEVIGGPIRDTAYYTRGGYWLVMVLEDSGEGDDRALHVQGILLDSNGEANEVKERIEAGEDFAELAQEYSLHSASKETGGDMGWLNVEDAKSRFGEDNFDGILGLGLNELSEPIHYATVSKKSGYWLIKVLGKEDMDLSEAHRDILVSKAFNDWLEAERESEENRIEDYLDNEKLFWALDHVKP